MVNIRVRFPTFIASARPGRVANVKTKVEKLGRNKICTIVVFSDKEEAFDKLECV